MKGISFNSLPLTDKALLVTEFAKFLMSLDSYNFRLHLYALNHHFVEVHYNNATKEVERIQMIEYAHLDKWLNKLELCKF